MCLTWSSRAVAHQAVWSPSILVQPVMEMLATTNGKTHSAPTTAPETVMQEEGGAVVDNEQVKG